MSRYLALLVEGNLDETVGRRIAEHSGLEVTVVYGKKGSGYIKSNVRPFAAAARGLPILTLVDLMDTGHTCPVTVLADWLPQRPPNMLLRIVVQEVESWLLADRENLAKFLSVTPARVPSDPELLLDPKRSLVNLARRSRSATVRRLLVPTSSTAAEGPAYTSELQRFAEEDWNIENARARAPSLERCLHAVSRLASAAKEGS